MKSAIFITLGTGVGSGIVTNGKIYEGENPGGAELGHMVIRRNGRLCTCNRKGCWECYASATALIRMATKRAKSDSGLLHQIWKEEGRLDGKRITDAVRKKDKAAMKVFDKYLSYLGEGLVNTINIFRPDVIYLGGGVCESFDLMEAYLNDYVKKHAFAGEYAKIPEICKAQHGNDAGIIGAAALLKTT